MIDLSRAAADFDFGIAALILLSYILIDGIYAYYSISVNKHHSLAAANSSAVLHLLYAIGVLSYVENYLYILPIALGSWIGTYIVVGKHLRSSSDKLES